MNTTAQEDMATYLGTKRMARMAPKERVIRPKSRARSIPPTRVAKISPREYRKVTLREFQRYLAPEPAKSQIQFFRPTKFQVSLRRFQSVRLIWTSLATG